MSKKERPVETEVADTSKHADRLARSIPDRLNMRKAASTMSDVIRILDKDTQLVVEEELGEWTRVHYPELNLSGYVMTHLIQKM